jgi:hypothetical protein
MLQFYRILYTSITRRRQILHVADYSHHFQIHCHLGVKKRFLALIYYKLHLVENPHTFLRLIKLYFFQFFFIIIMTKTNYMFYGVPAI